MEQEQQVDADKKISWHELPLNHPGEYHSIGTMPGGVVQFWVICAYPGGPEAEPERMVSIKVNNLDQGVMGNWEKFDNDEAARVGAQEYLIDNWDHFYEIQQERLCLEGDKAFV